MLSVEDHGNNNGNIHIDDIAWKVLGVIFNNRFLLLDKFLRI